MSVDISGCRVVQGLMEFSSTEQKRTILDMLCNPETLEALVCDSHGTYVAQACLPHLVQETVSLFDLVKCLFGRVTRIATNINGTFFLQRLIGILATHFPTHGYTCILQEEIFINLSQIIITEPGSRYFPRIFLFSEF